MRKKPPAFDIQPLGEVQGVIVAVPGEEAAFAELGGQFERGVPLDAHGDGGNGDRNSEDR